MLIAVSALRITESCLGILTSSSRSPAACMVLSLADVRWVARRGKKILMMLTIPGWPHWSEDRRQEYGRANVAPEEAGVLSAVQSKRLDWWMIDVGCHFGNNATSNKAIRYNPSGFQALRCSPRSTCKTNFLVLARPAVLSIRRKPWHLGQWSHLFFRCLAEPSAIHCHCVRIM